MSLFLKLNLVCILKLFRGKKIFIEVQYARFENRTFPSLFALGAVLFISRGALCRRNLVPRQCQPCWAFIPHLTALLHAAVGHLGTARHTGQGQPGAAHSPSAGGEVGAASSPEWFGGPGGGQVLVAGNDGHFFFLWALGVGECFLFLNCLSLPTELPRVHIFFFVSKQSLRGSIWLGPKREGRGGAKGREQLPGCTAHTTPVYRGKWLVGTRQPNQAAQEHMNLAIPCCRGLRAVTYTAEERGEQSLRAGTLPSGVRHPVSIRGAGGELGQEALHRAQAGPSWGKWMRMLSVFKALGSPGDARGILGLPYGDKKALSKREVWGNCFHTCGLKQRLPSIG